MPIVGEFHGETAGSMLRGSPHWPLDSERDPWHMQHPSRALNVFRSSATARCSLPVAPLHDLSLSSSWLCQLSWPPGMFRGTRSSDLSLERCVLKKAGNLVASSAVTITTWQQVFPTSPIAMLAGFLGKSARRVTLRGLCREFGGCGWWSAMVLVGRDRKSDAWDLALVSFIWLNSLIDLSSLQFIPRFSPREIFVSLYLCLLRTLNVPFLSVSQACAFAAVFARGILLYFLCDVFLSLWKRRRQRRYQIS